MNNLKKRLYDHCINYISQRIATAQKAIEDAQSAANDETKSSAGDKYETGRAMMQIEIEKNTVQLSEATRLHRILQRLNIDNQSEKIQLGNLVITDQGNFFLAISVGVVEVEKKKYAIVSPDTPIGIKLIGLQTNASFTFNGKIYKIDQVW